MANRTGAILVEIEAGRLEEANRLVQELCSMSGDPSVCNMETLAQLRRARDLAIVQRSHIQRRLSSLAASRPYNVAVQAEQTTWQING